jgi:3-hydroxyacyl-[acyl-carrier-protein] dehydratase
MHPEGPACAVAWTAVGIEHPCLAGHFPGQPLVPGVVLLECVLDVLHEWLAPRAVLAGIPAVKFARPLEPGDLFMIGIELSSATQARFVCRCGGNPVAAGTMLLAAPPE